MFITGSANATKRESAAILITTNTAFTVALSRVPMTNSQVTRPAIPMPGRVITPPSNGTRTTIRGTSMAKAFSTMPTTETDQRTDTTPAHPAYPKISAQPNMHATGPTIQANPYLQPHPAHGTTKQ